MHVEALRDAYAERLAICIADDIEPREAEQTAAVEIGTAAVRRFRLGDDHPEIANARPDHRYGAATGISDPVPRATSDHADALGLVLADFEALFGLGDRLSGFP